ncbi:methyl-accepting chemotaxis protein [Pseudomonas sp. NPDC077382]
MRANLPVSGHEVAVSDTANILSTTDLNGDITYANRDFITIAGFTEAELIGQHHNVIRHPDMPPEAFADLWEKLRTGRSWMGLVKNRCKNGDHYWVSAYATPVSRDGKVVEYQSVRVKPRTEQIRAAEALYRQLQQGTVPKALRRKPLGTRNKVSLYAALGALVAGTLGGWLSDAPIAVAILQPLLAAAGAAAFAAIPVASLKTIVGEARRVGKNPLSQLVYSGRSDELGEIDFAMKMLEAEAGAMVGRIADSSHRLSLHAQELSGAMQSSTLSASNQQHDTEQVATAIQQMVTSIQEVAVSAQRTADVAARAAMEADSGQRIVELTGASITRLAADIQQATEVILDVETRSQEISKVLDVISGIAEQTNLLALNAAIEAARAGDQGRGFAVVADEVRGLASRTSVATAEIHTMITTLQTGSQQAVEAMHRSREQAQHSVSSAAQAEQSLKTIHGRVNEISDMSSRIAVAVEQQSAVSEEISRNVASIRSGAESNLATGLQSQQSAKDVAVLAESMQALVQQFWSRRRA